MKMIYPRTMTINVIFIGIVIYFGWVVGVSIYSEKTLIIQNFIDTLIFISLVLILVFLVVAIKVDDKYVYIYKVYKKEKIDKSKIYNVSVNLSEYLNLGFLKFELNGFKKIRLISFFDSVPYSKTRENHIKEIIENINVVNN